MSIINSLRILQKESQCILFCLLSALLLAGCAHSGPRARDGLVMTSEAFQFFNGEYENTPHLRKNTPTSLAVVPFAKKEDAWPDSLNNLRPAQVIRIGMYNHLASLPFQDLEMHETDRRLKNNNLGRPDQVRALLQSNPKKLQSILGVDAVVTGTVTHFDRTFAGLVSVVEVGCEVAMWDTSNGNLLWRAKHKKSAIAGGVSLNPLGLVMSAAAALWNVRESSLYEQTDNLFREMVSSIQLPESEMVVAVKRPNLDFFVCLNADKPFKAGEKISFRIIGDPQCSAYVDLGDYKSGIALSPLAPSLKKPLQEQIIVQIKDQHKQQGHQITPELLEAIRSTMDEREIYEGTFVVERGEEAYSLMAKGYLVNKRGGMTTSIDAMNLISIDSIPPHPPRGLKSQSLDSKVQLQWLDNIEKDLAGYEILASSSPISGFNKQKFTESSAAILDAFSNFDKQYVRVVAVDKAGNTSKPTESIPVVALPEPGLYELPQPGPTLQGTINGEVLLVRKKGPYFIPSDLTIPGKAKVHIEPGTVLKFSPGSSLRLEGGELMAYGQKNNPVKFLPKEDMAQPGSYKGIIIESTPQCTLTHVLIEKAQTGLLIKEGSVSVSDSVIQNSSQAGIHLQSGAKPHFNCTRFVHNKGMGAIVIEGQGLAPQIHFNIFEKNEPFAVQSFAPVSVDLTKNYWGTAQPDPGIFLGQELLWTPYLKEVPAACQKDGPYNH